jgi:hypothetical protein
MAATAGGVVIVERLLIVAIAVAGVSVGSDARAETPQIAASVTFAHVAQADDESFLDGGFGKTPFGGDDEGPALAGGYLELRTGLGPTWGATLALSNAPDLDPALGITEASLTYRPLPAAGLRWRVKLGAFRPAISFEHGGAAWSTEYSILASALNTWIGEEVGGLGAEVRMGSDAAADPAAWQWDVFGAGFFGNDPAGTLLAWNGWSFWQGQTRWGDRIALPDLPIFDVARHQNPRVEPYLETDGRPGFYVGGTLERQHQYRVRVMYWDNMADPNSRNDGQWGWRTRFTSLSFQTTLPWDVGLLAQWLQGDSDTWEVPGIGAVVDMNFHAAYAALTKAFHSQYLTLRFDDYGVDDKDVNPLDDNDEAGHAYTVSYGWNITPHWNIAVERLWIRGYRDALETSGLDEYADESVTLATLRWQL